VNMNDEQATLSKHGHLEMFCITCEVTLFPGGKMLPATAGREARRYNTYPVG